MEDKEFILIGSIENENIFVEWKSKKVYSLVVDDMRKHDIKWLTVGAGTAITGIIGYYGNIQIHLGARILLLLMLFLLLHVLFDKAIKEKYDIGNLAPYDIRNPVIWKNFLQELVKGVCIVCLTFLVTFSFFSYYLWRYIIMGKLDDFVFILFSFTIIDLIITKSRIYKRYSILKYLQKHQP